MGLGALPVLLPPGHSSIQQIQSRNTLKDTIIIIQSILLVIFISIPMLLFLDKVSDSISSSGDVPSFVAAVLTAMSCILGRTLLGMGTGRHWVWGCCMRACLAELENKHLKWYVGLCGFACGSGGTWPGGMSPGTWDGASWWLLTPSL